MERMVSSIQGLLFSIINCLQFFPLTSRSKYGQMIFLSQFHFSLISLLFSGRFCQLTIFRESSGKTQVVLNIFDTVKLTNEVVIQKENFNKFSNQLEKISSILKSLPIEDIENPESLKDALDVLNQAITVAKQLVFEGHGRSKIYVLMNSRRMVARLKCCGEEIRRALRLIPLASKDISEMLDVEYEDEDEQVLEKVEGAIQERNLDGTYANELLCCIADAMGVPKESDALKREFQELKREMESARSRKDVAEALRMEKLIAVLERADLITSVQEKEIRYFEKRNSLGRTPLEPLHSFYCPISGDIMLDPVETSSRKTFERSAIQRWFSQGNTLCPLTMLPLDTRILRPNKTLRHSIQEWKDRNTIITISTIKSLLETNEQEQVLESLDKLQDLCLERQIHLEWLKMENFIALLIGLLGSRNREIRKRVLLILSLLAKDDTDNKQGIAKVDGALRSIVHSLARQIEESKLALKLLLELSKTNILLQLIGNVQGGILLIVTMLNSDDVEAAKIAHELLENLSFLDQNVIEMAKANYLKPLLLNLSTGAKNVKILMAETVSEIELTEQNKLSLVKDGAVRPLLGLLLENDVEIKKVVVKCLLKLSSLLENGMLMIKQGVTRPLLELLYSHSLQSPALQELIVATIMHLAISTTHQQAEEERVLLLDSEEQALCQSLSGFTIRMWLRQISAAKVLVHLVELNTHAVRVNALKLCYCLTEDGDHRNISSHITERFIKVLMNIIQASDDAEEMVAAIGIISRLPQETHITEWLLDSGALQTISACLKDQHKHASHRKQVTENSVEALGRFTVSANPEWQKRVAEAGMIPVLVQLLASGTPLSKQKAAISMKQLSESSYCLSKPIKKASVLKRCFTAQETGCPAHLGTCTIESSFCMLQGKALEPLVRMLSEQDVGTCEASLDALMTLLDGQTHYSGSKVLVDANAVAPMIKLLSVPASRLQEKTLTALGQIFQLDEVRNKYKAMATMPLVDITQSKDSRLKSLAAKGLAQLGLLDKQSSYF
nr:U-box domain-containing protein 44-like isoform X2 [Arachis hypogaea]